MMTKGYTGPFKAQPGRMGSAEVVRMEDDQSYAHLLIARFEDLSHWGGPSAMDQASRYVQLLEGELEGKPTGCGAGEQERI